MHPHALHACCLYQPKCGYFSLSVAGTAKHQRITGNFGTHQGQSPCIAAVAQAAPGQGMDLHLHQTICGRLAALDDDSDSI